MHLPKHTGVRFLIALSSMALYAVLYLDLNKFKTINDDEPVKSPGFVIPAKAGTRSEAFALSITI